MQINNLAVDEKKYPKLNLLVDPNDGCNLNCLHCGLDSPHLVHFSKQTCMNTENYTRMLGILKDHIISLSLGCIREPLVHPQIEDLIKISDTILPAGHLSLNTNGIRLTEDIVDLLLTCQNDWHLNISIESATPATYEKIRRGAKFKSFYDNMRYLIEARCRFQKKITITFSCVIMNINLDDFPELLSFATDLGIDTILPLSLQIHNGNQNLALTQEQDIRAQNMCNTLRTDSSIKGSTRLASLRDDLQANLPDEQSHDTPTVIIMNQHGHIFPPGRRTTLGCIFKPEDIPKIFSYYKILPV